MTDRKKNLMVGIVVLGSLIVLAWMLVAYGGLALAPFTPSGAGLTIVTEHADGVSQGSLVVYRGIQVGQVRGVKLGEDMTHIHITVELRPDARVPSNVVAIIRPQGVIGSTAIISLELTSPTPQQPLLAAGAELTGRTGGMTLLPEEFTQLAVELRTTTQLFRESGVIAHLDQAITNISVQSTKAGEVLQSIQDVVGDEEMKTNLHQSMANINEATLTARKIAGELDKFSVTLNRSGENLDRLAGEATETVRDARGLVKSAQTNVDKVTAQISERLVQVSGMLDSFSSLARKMDQGKGTMGLLANDPRLYESLVASAKSLSVMMDDLQRLVEQWEQEGMTLKLNP